MAKGNKEYKSDVFSMLMQDRRRALEVYNAINGTAYDDPAQVELTTRRSSMNCVFPMHLSSRQTTRSWS